MRVSFRVNLGSNDAQRHGLDFRSCHSGAECSVSDSTGNWLVDRGIATEVPETSQASPATELPVELLAVPDAPEIGETPETAIKAEAKSPRKKSSTPSKDE